MAPQTSPEITHSLHNPPPPYFDLDNAEATRLLLEAQQFRLNSEQWSHPVVKARDIQGRYKWLLCLWRRHNLERDQEDVDALATLKKIEDRKHDEIDAVQNMRNERLDRKLEMIGKLSTEIFKSQEYVQPFLSA